METVMNRIFWKRTLVCLFTISVFTAACYGCDSQIPENPILQQETSAEPDVSHFLVAVEDEHDTVDFQCTSIHYTVAQNVFNRLVEMENDANGEMEVLPSLAESWDISEDGRDYTFHLRKNITFSNGSPLTASDVQYTFTRLLTHPDSCNQDIVDIIAGASALENGETDTLEGFKVIDDLNFVVTLEEPFEAFLAYLSMPAASILDEETTTEAGERFGTDPEWTIGTGSFILWKWVPGDGMLLIANKNCWLGEPKCGGLNLRFMTDAGYITKLFDAGDIDVLDLDEAGNTAEYYIHGEIYKDRLFKVQRIGITYIALNESIEPLNDVRVRKAMQLALDRGALLAAVYGDNGYVENGIFPHGLYGYNPDLPEIPYDPEAAAKLLKEAGYEDGFDLTVSVNSASTRWELAVLRLAASMWEQIGIRAGIDVMDESEFMKLRKSGQMACYTAQWMADFNDPDNFIYTFYGNESNTTFRSLCYPREDIMERIQKARTISDRSERIHEYNELERIIVQEDAAWIPLFSRQRYYVTSQRLEGIQASWNGSVKNKYREMTILYENP